MEEASKKCPGFFKVYMPNGSSQSLHIPPAFAFHMKGQMPDKTFLRNYCGKLWPVEVAKIGNDLFFQDGWVKFTEDNYVEFGDFLVFQFDGNHVFHVKLYGKTACEKEVTGAFAFEVKEEEEEEDFEKQEEEDFEKQEEEEEEEEEDEEEEEELEAKTIHQKSIFGYKGYAAVKVKGGYGGASIMEVEGDDIFETGLFVRPKNPYFVRKIRPYKRPELFIPADVIKDNNLKLPPEIVMRDQDGKMWCSKVVVWNDGRTCLTGGWKAFCKWNNLQVDDRCICEFVPAGGQQQIFLQIQVVRAGSWLPK